MVAILHPTGLGSQIQIDRAVVLIGRSPECDVVLDFSTRISRMHCALVQVDNTYYIRDLGSMNGITVAGQRVEKDQLLTNGVEVVIGDVKYLFLDNVLPAPKVARPSAGMKANPVLIDETINVQDVEEVEIIEPTTVRRAGASSPPPPTRPATPRAGAGNVRPAPQQPKTIEDAYIIEEVEIVEDVEVLDDPIEVVEIVEEVELVEDVEVLDDVEVIDESPRRPRRPPRRY